MPNQSLITLIVALGLSTVVSCAPSVRSYQQRGAICQEYTIPITINFENYVYNATKFVDNLDLVNFTTASSTVNSSSIFLPVEALPVNETVSLEVFGTFCQPSNTSAGRDSTVLVATHGIGTDGRWVC